MVPNAFFMALSESCSSRSLLVFGHADPELGRWVLFFLAMHCITLGLMLYAAITAWFSEKWAALLCLVLTAAFAALGWLMNIDFKAKPWILISLLVGLPLSTAAVIFPHKRATAMVLASLAGLYLIVLGSHFWNERKPARQNHANWVADVATDPESLVAARGLRGVDFFHLGYLSEDDLKLLRNTTRLKHLDLMHSLSKGEQLEYLAGLTELQSLSLDCNDRVQDADLRHLRGLTQLRRLNLRSCSGLSSAGLEHLKPLSHLQELNLCFCRGIHDGAVVHLKPLTNLTFLNVTGTNLSEGGIKLLQKTLPRCTIETKSERWDDTP